MRRSEIVWMLALGLLFGACRKDHTTPSPAPPPAAPAKKVLLKDIIIPHLPSPYYHFEYNSDNRVATADFSDGYTIYDVVYDGNKIAEMRNKIFVAHDTLRYVYDNTGKVALIVFINQANVVYRHVIFTYTGNLVTQMEWDHKGGDGGFLIDRTVTLAYYADSNLKTLTDHRPALDGSVEYTAKTQFEQYDDGINVDDFDLVHDGIHDHLFLFQGFRLQKNNPARVSFSAGAGNAAYTVNYTYTYNSDRAPVANAGDLLYTDGPDAGKRFPLSTAYTYY